MLKLIIAILPVIGICYCQADLTVSLFIGVDSIGGVELPATGEDHLHPCGFNNFPEYPLPGGLAGAPSFFVYDEIKELDFVMVCGGFSMGMNAITDKCFIHYQQGIDEEWINGKEIDLIWPVVRPGYTKFVDEMGDQFLWITGGSTGPSWTTIQTSQVLKFSGADVTTWMAGVDLPMPLYGQCMVQLNATHVLITGGDQHGGAQNMVFDWEKGTFANVGDFIGGERFLHGCTKMADGRVMVAAGYRGASDTEEAQNLDTVEIFDPVTETWSEGAKLAEALDGNVLVGVNYGAWAGDVLHMGGHIPDSLNGGEPIPVDTIYRYKHHDNNWELLQYRMKKPRAHFNVIPIPEKCPQ